MKRCRLLFTLGRRTRLRAHVFPPFRDVNSTTMSAAAAARVDYENLKISSFRLLTRERLSCMLNAKKVLPSPDNRPRDWRGMCSLLDYNIPLGCDPTDPIGKILKVCKDTTIAYFIQCLEQIDRYDVIEETAELIASDIAFFKERSLSLVNQDPVRHNNINKIFTIEDIKASYNQRPLSRYDAYVLFDDADLRYAEYMVEKLEYDLGLKLCLKNRNLKPNLDFVYQSEIEFISERCNWLIIIISDNFANDPLNVSIMKHIQALGIEQHCPKIIPCIFDDCPLPPELKGYVKLFFNESSCNYLYDPWNRLKITVSSNNYKALVNSMCADDSIQKCSVEESTKSCSKADAQNEIEMPDEELNNNMSPKRRNALGRFMKSLGSISIKVIPQKWNNDKSNKKKIPTDDGYFKVQIELEINYDT